MLLELSIADFAIIDRARIQFSPHLNAITGETGAGKSIILDALSAVLGSRVSPDLVRTGAKSARVEAVFTIDDAQGNDLARELENAGIEIDDERTLVLSRDIQSSGRSISRVNGRTTTGSQLGRIGSFLVDIHGQSDHLAILRTTEQRSLLDRFAGVAEERSEVARLASRLRAVRSQLSDLLSDSQERERQLDLLRFQVEEIESAALIDSEDVALGSEREVLLNADRLREDAAEAVVNLVGDDALDQDASAATRLRIVEKAIADLASVDGGASNLLERATDLVVLSEELGRELRDYAERVDIDPTRLADVEDRLSLLQTLKRKYGNSIEDIRALGEAARAELDQATSGDRSIGVLEEDARATERDLRSAAGILSKRRQESAADLANQIEISVAELRMGRATAAIQVRRRPELSGIEWEEDGVVTSVHFDESGVDDIVFLIAPNTGESLKPLSRIASGGETARIMLALKSILSEIDSTPTLVFDEIDVGVGGRSGQVVGEKLIDVARHRQVIVVTHLPQIAAVADIHFRISKEERQDRTISTIDELDERERIVELAAMLDGVPVSDASLASARDMLVRSRGGVFVSPEP